MALFNPNNRDRLNDLLVERERVRVLMVRAMNLEYSENPERQFTLSMVGGSSEVFCLCPPDIVVKVCSERLDIIRDELLKINVNPIIDLKHGS